MENSDFNFIFQKKKKINIHKAYLHLTQRCNLKCRYCYNADNIGKTQDLNSEEWKKILFNLREKGFDYIIFTGGEVLLRKDLLELSKYTKQLDFKLNILTNGTFELTRELIETVDFIEISLDSMENNINDINRVNSSKYNIIGNLYRISPDLRNKIIIKTVLSKENYKSITFMRDELEKIGYKRMEIIPQQPTNPNEIDIYPDFVISRKPHKFDFGKVTKCNACYEIIAINANGDIYPCQALIKKKMLLTNIFKINWFEEINNHMLTEFFFNNDINNSECKKCAYKYLCGGPCKAVSYNLTGSLLEGRGEYCKHAKKECQEYLRSIQFGGES